MKYQQMTRNFYVFATLMFTREKAQHSTQLLETPLYKGKELGGVLATFTYQLHKIILSSFKCI